jgi:hypothetical protein
MLHVFLPIFASLQHNPSHLISVAHFLPDFLMPCEPVLRGPFPPAFFASSSLAFLSEERRDVSTVQCCAGRSIHRNPAQLEPDFPLILRTSLLLSLES